MRAVNAKGEGEFSSPSAPEHPLRQPDAPGAPVGTRGDKTITVSWGAPGNGGDPIIEYQVQILSTGATNTTTGDVDPLGQPAQRPAPAVHGAGPQPGRVGRGLAGVGARRAVRRARRARRRGGRPRRRQRDGLVAAPRTTRAARSAATRSRPAAAARSASAAARRRRRSAGSATARRTRSRSSPATTSATAPAARRPTPSCRPGLPGAPTITGGHPRHQAGRRSRGTRANDNGSADHRRTSCRSTAAAGRTSAPARRTPAPGSPTARRTRSSCGPSTTSAPVPAATRCRRRRRARRTRSAASTSAAATRPDPGHVVGAQRQRQADRPLRGRARRPAARSHATSDTAHTFERAAADDTTYTVQRPGLQQRSAAARGAAGRRRRPTRPAPQATSTWSSYGSAVGQPNCSTPQCAYVHVTATGFTPGQDLHRHLPRRRQGAFSGSTSDGRRQRRRRRPTTPATSGTTSRSG